jgi:competence ComEA-like helix-hairpin-helix protein
VKQNFPSARVPKVPVLWLLTALLIFHPGCTTHSRQVAVTGDRVPTTTAININAADAAELESLPGIGKIIAERIIEHRSKYGPFRRVEHLMMVRGISEERFLKLRPFITAQ